MLEWPAPHCDPFRRMIGHSAIVKRLNWILGYGFGEDSGGFLCVPGSHKAKYPIPRGLTTSIDLPQVQKPALKAGDVLLFGGVAHGTTAWRSDRMRRTTIQFMGSSNVALPPGKKSAGWRWSTDLNNPSNAAKTKA